ncbi:MAG TPA: GNAT family N-acetyltransferase [Lacunisphaera sp.]|nr:GNAT family N-acetyltransferase [Lacunisphaera sp.]
MPSAPIFRPYQPADLAACLALFDGNCPEFFAPNERADYVEFLAPVPAGYEVCLLGKKIVGAFGVLREAHGLSLRWIHVSPDAQGRGLGRTIMARVVAAVRAHGGEPLHIAASQKSAPFFSKFGAKEVRRTPDGWGPGMHRVDLLLPSAPPGLSADG